MPQSTTRFFRPVHLRIPALAAYSPAQAVLFVRLAAGSLYRRITRWCVASLIALVTCWLLGAPAFLVVPLITSNKVVQGIAQGASAFVIILVPFFALIVRDLLVTHRASAILKRASRCRKCRAAIDLHTADERLAITCHACKAQFKLPHPIGALTSRSDETLALVETHARSRRRTIAATIGGVLTIALAGNEVFIHTQAARAAKDIVSPEQLVAFCNERLPASHDPTEPNAWLAVRSARDMLRAAGIKDRQLQLAKFNSLYDPDPPATEEFQRAADAAEAQRAREIFDTAVQQGALAALESLPASLNTAFPIDTDPTTPLLLDMLDSDLCALAHRFASLNLVAMHEALERADHESFVATLRINSALARMCERSPEQTGALIALALEQRTTRMVWLALDRHPDPDVIRTLGAELRSDPTLPQALRAIAGERLIVNDYFARLFAKPTNVRLGLFSLPHRASEFWAFPTAWLGTYEANRGFLDREYERAEAIFATPPHLRRDEAFELPTSRLALMLYLTPTTHGFCTATDHVELYRRTNPTRVALELYFASNSRYPKTLTELVPQWLPALPIDPWSQAPFAYRTPDAADSPSSASFVLYSVASDGADDGGKQLEGRPTRAIATPALSGQQRSDFILNPQPR